MIRRPLSYVALVIVPAAGDADGPGWQPWPRAYAAFSSDAALALLVVGLVGCTSTAWTIMLCSTCASRHLGAPAGGHPGAAGRGPVGRIFAEIGDRMQSE